MHEILMTEEMAEADRLAGSLMLEGSYALMRAAAEAVAGAVLRHYAEVSGVDILCGPGNNGGDGYCTATQLFRAGIDVRIWSLAAPKSGTDATRAAAECPVRAMPLADYTPRADHLVIDALYGAGLSRPLEGEAQEALARARLAGVRSLAVDLPSGVSGGSGLALGNVLPADRTITFFRRKPGHLLYPGRALCGIVTVADIGIPANVIEEVAPRCHENGPSLWLERLPRPLNDMHKYSRGHVAVFSGPETMTGAARLCARASARIGAGAVTLLSRRSALHINAAHLTSILLRAVDTAEELMEFLQERKPGAMVLGPGFGIGDTLRGFAAQVIETENLQRGTLVLDADAFSSYADHKEALFALGARAPGQIVLTPHEGEFARLFPDLAADMALSKLERARQAASRSHCVIVLKGPDTVIAAPDGDAVINGNGTACLATAGSGDVLAGMIAGLCAQAMPPFSAACAAVWLHAESARAFGPGLIAEDLPEQLPAVLARVFDLEGEKER